MYDKLRRIIFYISEVVQMIKIAICDDVPSMVHKLETNLLEYMKLSKKEATIFKFYNGIQLIDSLKQEFDIIFLDINMPFMDGIEVAEEIRSTNTEVTIIFLTSVFSKATEGYKVNATSFIIKPIDKKRLKLEMDSWFQKHSVDETSYFIINNDLGNYKMNIREIKYLETFNRNLLIHTLDKNVICYDKLIKIEEELKEFGFSRIHTGYLVNMLHVQTVEKMEVTLIGGEKLPISKLKKKSFMSNLALFWGDRL